MPVKLSYINARNEEVILDDDERSFAGELAGRTGFEMPQIETKVVTYGDGTQDIVYSRLKTRTVTCYFWVDIDNKVEFERHLDDVKAKILQVGSRMGDWGKLKIRQKDGEYRYLKCIYKGGFDGIVRDSNSRLKFSLTFDATDPIFYNTFETKYIIQVPKDAEWLLMKELMFNGKKRSKTNYNFTKDNYLDNPDGLYMRAKTQPYDPTGSIFDTDRPAFNPNTIYMKTPSMNTENEIELPSARVYPTITIEGAAKNIRIYNKLTNKMIQLHHDIEVGHGNYLKIETKPLHRKIISVDEETGKETNLIEYMTGSPDEKDFPLSSTLDFPLEYGTNTIYYRNTYSAPDSKLTFTYTEGWLSCD